MKKSAMVQVFYNFLKLILFLLLFLATHDSFTKRGYRLGAEIGRGGFGVVYSGVQLDTMQHVAIKYVSRRNVTYWSTVINNLFA